MPLAIQQLKIQWLTYSLSPATFVAECVHIYDATGRDWVKFHLWPAQAATLDAMASSRKLVILKARQLGITWLALSYALWLLLFHPPATVLLFSLREEEAKELLWRLRGMYDRLPACLRARAVTHSNETRWILSNGSRALAFSTRSGRSYTGTLALVDEADFVPELSQFLNAVKPTVDAGGQLFLVSTSDKKRPISTFKNLFRAAAAASGPITLAGASGRNAEANASCRNAEAGASCPGAEISASGPAAEASASAPAAAGDYRHVFLPWWARPDRDEAWRRAVQAEMFAQRGTDDDFFAEYPATPEEALAAEQLDRRLPYAWLRSCLDAGQAPWAGRTPALPGLTVWDVPVAGRRYVIGADPAEGNPNSDESAASVIDTLAWGQVAELTGKIEPSVFAGYLDELGRWYNTADVMVERNNHGHLLIRELQRLGNLRVLQGYDGKPGWLSSVKGKPLLYGLLADAVRDNACVIRGRETATQLAGIEASSLRAPAGMHDDRADAFALAIAGVAWRPDIEPSAVVAQTDVLAEYDGGAW